MVFIPFPCFNQLLDYHNHIQQTGAGGFATTAKRKAFSYLYDNYSAALFSIINSIVTDRDWDTASSSVFLVVKNLPKLPSEKQYQLWAFIEGKPVDLGLFDPDNKNVILQMKNTQKAEAFAITIEKRGNGSIHKDH